MEGRVIIQGMGERLPSLKLGLSKGETRKRPFIADTELRLEIVRDARAAVPAVAFAHDVFLGQACAGF